MTKKKREQVWNKYNKHCAYCGCLITYKELYVDHLIPQARDRWYKDKEASPVHKDANLMPSCYRCNHYKRAHSLEVFRNLLRTLHERIEKIYIAKVAIDYNIINIAPFNGVFYFESLEENK